MRIYTRGGDDGTTGLFGGDRVRKDHAQVAAYGAVDELNAVLGWARAAGPPAEVDDVLAVAQEACFRLGAWLACVPGRDPGVRAVDQEDVEALEAAIDAAETELEPLRHFVMPCGCEAAVRLHVARTTCRRAERVIVALGGEGVDPAVLRWVNRLSDLLFVQARWANHEAGVPDVPWAPKRT